MSAVLKAQVLGALRERPLTTNEVARELDLNPLQCRNAITALFMEGRVVKVGKRAGPTGYPVAVWALTGSVDMPYDDRTTPDGTMLPEFRWKGEP